MKEKIISKAKQIKQDPKVNQAVSSMKPEKSILGFLGVILFFIAPEVIAFFWGEQINAYAKDALAIPAAAAPMTYYYEALLFLFEEGVSWSNLIIGIAFLIWLFL